MKQLEHPPVIALWQINLLRVGYVVMGGGLAVFKWPLLFDHEPWSLAEGTVECLLVGMSLLALLGLRYPVRMLPILLFEVTWKLIWLGVVALPSWLDGTLDAATREQTGKVLWVAIVIAVIPWRFAVATWATAAGDPWRPASTSRPLHRPSTPVEEGRSPVTRPGERQAARVGHELITIENPLVEKGF